MGHCRTHGHYPDDWTHCEDCERAEERLTESLQELQRSVGESEDAARRRAERAEELAEEHAYLLSNPGEYKCPHCLYITLKRSARRCRACHGEVDEAYWADVAGAEHVARQRAETERRALREQQAAAEAARQKTEADAAEAELRSDEDWARFWRGVVSFVAAANLALYGVSYFRGWHLTKGFPFPVFGIPFWYLFGAISFITIRDGKRGEGHAAFALLVSVLMFAVTMAMLSVWFAPSARP